VSFCLRVFVFTIKTRLRAKKHEDTKTERHEENIFFNICIYNL